MKTQTDSSIVNLSSTKRALELLYYGRIFKSRLTRRPAIVVVMLHQRFSLMIMRILNKLPVLLQFPLHHFRKSNSASTGKFAFFSVQF